MGWADMLMKMGVSYNSEAGCALGKQVMEFIDYHSKVESIELAKKRGKFGNFAGSVYDRANYLSEKCLNICQCLFQQVLWHLLYKLNIPADHIQAFSYVLLILHLLSSFCYPKVYAAEICYSYS